MTSKSPPVNVDALALGAAFIIALIPGLWKTSTLRSAIFRDWSDRVEIFKAGLSDKATASLLRLQTEIAAALGSPTQPFNPLSVITDLSRLTEPVSNFQHLLNAHRKLDRRYATLLRLSLPLACGLLAAGAGAILMTLDYAHLVDIPLLGTVGLIVFSVGAFDAMAIGALYAYLQHALGGTEIMASPHVA